MVARAVVAVALAGCLGKPAVPIAGGGDGGVDASGDGGAGCTPLPSGLVVRQFAKVVNLDASGGSATDDLIVLGREASLQGAAYLVRGSPTLDLTCYARRFPLDGLTVEPLDVTAVDVTRDGHVDLLLLGRDDGPEANYQVHLYEGQADGTLEATPQIVEIPKTFFGIPDFGGSLTSPEPAYIDAWTSGLNSEVVLGSLYELATLYFNTSTGQLPSAAAAFDGGGLVAMDYIQNIAVDPTASTRLIFVSQGVAQVFERQAPASPPSMFTRTGEAMLTTPALPRSARFARAPVAAAALGATTQPDGFDLIRTDVAGAVTVGRLPMVIPGNYVPEDLAFGDVNGNGIIDLVALFRTNSAPEVVIHLDLGLDFMTGPSSAATVRRTIGAGSNVLAVGDFDGQPATPDQVLALTTAIDGDLGACYHVVAGSPAACLVACGDTACP